MWYLRLRFSVLFASFGALGLAAVFAAGCPDQGTSCETQEDCFATERCVDTISGRRCVAESDLEDIGGGTTDAGEEETAEDGSSDATGEDAESRDTADSESSDASTDIDEDDATDSEKDAGTDAGSDDDAGGCPDDESSGSNADCPPVVDLQRPKANATVCGVTLLETTASARGDELDRVEFTLATENGNEIGEMTAQSPQDDDVFVAEWGTREVEDGPYDLTAEVFEEDGDSASESRSIVVDNQSGTCEPDPTRRCNSQTDDPSCGNPSGTLAGHHPFDGANNSHSHSVYDVALSPNGVYAYVVGKFQDDFNVCGSDLPHESGDDAYVAKVEVGLDSMECRWAKSITGENDLDARTVGVDVRGNVYLAGSCLGPPGDDPVCPDAGSQIRQAWTARYSPRGDREWMRRHEETARPIDISVEAPNDLVVTGEIEGDGGAYTHWLKRLAPDSPIETEWTATGDGETGFYPGATLVQQHGKSRRLLVFGLYFGDQNPGNLEVHGTGSSTADFESSDSNDGWSAAFDYETGAVQAARRIGDGSESDNAADAALDRDGDVWVGLNVDSSGEKPAEHRYCNDDVDTEGDIALVEYQPDLFESPDPKESGCMVGPGPDALGEFTFADDDELVLSGTYNQSLDLRPGASKQEITNSSEDSRVFVASLTSDFGYNWDFTTSGEQTHYSPDLAVGPWSPGVVVGFDFEKSVKIGGETYETGTSGTFPTHGLLFSVFR